MEFIVIGLIGLIGAPFLGFYVGSHATAIGFCIFGFIGLGIGLYWGQHSTFDTSEGPLFMSLCYSVFWFLFWMLLGFLRSNEALIRPHMEQIKDLLFK